jgi:hypothetical protein
MKSIIITLLMAVLVFQKSNAQPIPIEVMAGDEHYWYQHVITKKFNGLQRFGFFHVSSLHVFYDRTRTDEIMSQSYLTYEVVPGIVGAVGTFYSTGPGLSPSLAVQLYKKFGDMLLMVVPRVDIKDGGSYEAMSLAEYRPILFRDVRLYSRVQVMSNFTGQNHNRSYQNLRAGLDIKKLQFGVAINIDEYGTEKQTYHNLGFFLRTEL